MGSGGELNTLLKMRRIIQLCWQPKRYSSWISRFKSNPTDSRCESDERVRKAEVRQKETIALYMPHKLNVAHFNTYDTPEFSVVKDVAALTEGNVGGVAASLFRKEQVL